VKAAVLCSRLLKNHPLPDGNKRAAWVSLHEFHRTQRLLMDPPPVDEAEATVLAVASSELSEEDFAAWLGPRIAMP
jgi:death-on-curing protein